MSFFFCEFGQSVSSEFNSFDHEIYQCDWYTFPMNLQQMLVILMLDTQQSMYIRGYGNIVCSRDTFKKV